MKYSSFLFLILISFLSCTKDSPPGNGIITGVPAGKVRIQINSSCLDTNRGVSWQFIRTFTNFSRYSADGKGIIQMLLGNKVDTTFSLTIDSFGLTKSLKIDAYGVSNDSTYKPKQQNIDTVKITISTFNEVHSFTSKNGRIKESIAL